MNLTWDSSLVDFSVVAAIGALVGATELIARYEDEPIRAIRQKPAWLYIFVNVIAAVIALALARLFDWNFFADPQDGDQQRWMRIFVAGFGAMFVLRSSFFVARGVGDDDGELNVGPSNVLKVILDVADQGVDRIRADQRAREVNAIMQGVDFSKASTSLPLYVLSLLRNASPEDQAAFSEQVKQLSQLEGVENNIKTLNLGLLVMSFAGAGVLTAAVQSLGDNLRVQMMTEPPPPSGAGFGGEN
jgi:hypothetical protein